MYVKTYRFARVQKESRKPQTRHIAMVTGPQTCSGSPFAGNEYSRSLLLVILTIEPFVLVCGEALILGGKSKCRQTLR